MITEVPVAVAAVCLLGKVRTQGPEATKCCSPVFETWVKEGNSSFVHSPVLPAVSSSTPPPVGSDAWHHSLANAIRDPEVLLQRLGLPMSLLEPARRASSLFPVFVPISFLQRMQPGNPSDPLLRQVFPIDREYQQDSGSDTDVVGDLQSRRAPGLLHKYHGRALLITTGVCAIHCRYCFRRHYDYGMEPRRLDEWEPALELLSNDSSIEEILLSGGDPLMLTDARMADIIHRLADIPHLKRLRIHSRLPIVLPDRITPSLLRILRQTRLTPIMVVHANHPHEIAGDCEQALRTLVQSGITTLNQSVLLRGVNDEARALTQLSERLINLGVIPYYLHQLDLVPGAGHFEVDVSVGRGLIAELRRQLPGYAVPQYVREEAGAAHKTPL